MARDVLLVDDSAVVRKTLEAYLNRYGVPSANIHLATTAREGMDRFREVGPKVVLMDIQLPDQDGDQVASVMLEQDPNTILVVVSAMNEEDPRVRDLMSLGAFSFLRKPLRYDTFRRMLDEVEQEIEGAIGTGRIT